MTKKTKKIKSQTKVERLEAQRREADIARMWPTTPKDETK